MYKHILIPTDGSALSAKAIEQGGAKVTGVTVSIPFHAFALDPTMVSDTWEHYKKDCEDRAQQSLGAVRLAAEAAGVPCDVVHVTADPYEGIIDTAIGRGCDLIYLASHGRKGISALLLVCR
jgi:nucleotide-binding universal stress UspA family protein